MKMALDIPNTFGYGKLISKGGKLCGPEELKEKERIGLYFSAHWCPPCRGFTPRLAEYYQMYNSKSSHGKLEIVFVSSDQNEREFNEYFAEMPWIALKFKERDTKVMLDKKYGISGIPTFVILDNNGNLITKNGRGQVLEYLNGD
ncbi:nucleoredoxin-like [Mercenaria mercenaria]|uniref:nucleoredoxin-like n=1 Tax=Mercenaria mercenaria TaxID=6596 RepID=UPI00234FAD5A|nr:nucleoredoxin-like [Mercenaria mercenaria]